MGALIEKLKPERLIHLTGTKYWITVRLLIIAAAMVCVASGCNNNVSRQFRVDQGQYQFKFKYPLVWHKPWIDTSAETEITVNGEISTGANSADAVFAIVVGSKEKSWPDSQSELEFFLGQYPMILPDFVLIDQNPIIVDGMKGSYIEYSYNNTSSESVLGYGAYFEDTKTVWGIEVRGLATLETKVKQAFDEICESLERED